MEDKKRVTRKALRAGATAAMVTLGFLSGQRVGAATVTLPIQANLINAVEITLNRSLDFGTLVMTHERAGVATIDPFVNKLYVDGNSSLSSAGGEPKAGRVQIIGGAHPVFVSMENATVRLTNGASYVEVNDFNFQTLQGGSRMTVTATSTAQPFLVDIGATIRTRPGQLTGTYVGSTKVFANFQ